MIVAIIPARGGSKRIPRKNLALLCGRPLIHYTLDAAIGALGRRYVFVSTEDAGIREISTEFGVHVIKRPAEIATDGASTESVLIHALQDPLVRDSGAQWVLTLPPTSPLRSLKTIQSFLERVRSDSDGVDCYFSVTENRADFWRRRDDGCWTRLFPEAPRRQQDRTPLFEENSAIYLTRIDALLQSGSILGTRAEGIEISASEGLDVNSFGDLSMAEVLMAASGDQRASGAM